MVNRQNPPPYIALNCWSGVSEKRGWPWEVEDLSISYDCDLHWPLVSIIMPSLNQGQFIEEAIRSVLMQGYPNLEFIVLDGGSTDGSVEIIKKYSSMISFWVSEKDQGQSDAINRGFLRSKGEILAWLNSDDVFLPGCIFKMANAFQDHPEAGLIFGDVEVINERGNKVGKFEPVHYSFEETLSFRQIIPQQAAFFRKEVLYSVGLLDPQLDFAMDLDFFIRIGKNYPVIAIPEVLAQFRMSAVNKGSLKRFKWAPEFVKIAEKFYKSENLSMSVLHLKPKVFGGAYYRGAASFLEDGMLMDARKWFIRAAQADPAYLRKPGWWKKMLKTFLGIKGIQCLNLIKIFLKKHAFTRFDYDWQVGLGAVEKIGVDKKEKSS